MPQVLPLHNAAPFSALPVRAASASTGPALPESFVAGFASVSSSAPFPSKNLLSKGLQRNWEKGEERRSVKCRELKERSKTIHAVL